MKSIKLSKTVWFNFLYTVIEIAALATETLPLSVRWLAIVVLIQGSVNIILRVWFTKTGLTFRSE
ncbi:hypothetical protein IH981_02115 [Patescibacteria group bacterium]|nr:hypothetical protein [Patescibacteria group bacterium]